MSTEEPTFRRFVMFQHKGARGARTGVVGYGVEFPNGKVAICEDNAGSPVWTFDDVAHAEAFYATDSKPYVTYVDREFLGAGE